nr:hypothetical protein [uncultured Roseateles sp.]
MQPKLSIEYIHDGVRSGANLPERSMNTGKRDGASSEAEHSAALARNTEIPKRPVAVIGSGATSDGKVSFYAREAERANERRIARHKLSRASSRRRGDQFLIHSA